MTGTAAAPGPVRELRPRETLEQPQHSHPPQIRRPRPGFSVYPTSGAQQGAVRGPGGQIWLIGYYLPTQFQGAVQLAGAGRGQPGDGAVSYWAPLPPYLGSAAAPTLLAYDDGPPAFDGSGNERVIATATTRAGAVSHDLVRYTPGPSTSHVYRLARRVRVARRDHRRGRRIGVAELRVVPGVIRVTAERP